MKDRLSEKIYKIIGSSHSPTEDRKELINYLQKYLIVCDKLEEIKSVTRDITNFFKKYPNIKGFFTSIEKDKDSLEFYYAKDTGIIYVNSKISEESKPGDTVSEIEYIVFNNEKFLKQCLNHSIDSLDINRENIEEILHKIILPHEKVIYDSIENFEKNKLEKTITLNRKKRKILKV